MAMNPRLLRPTSSGDSPASIPGLALWLDAAAADALYTTDAGPVTAVSSPLDISGCVLWLDGADSSSMKQNSDGTGAVAAGDPIGYWQDKSASAAHVTGSAAARPTLTSAAVNGYAAPVFNGSSTNLSKAGYTATNSLSGMTRIAVCGNLTNTLGAVSRVWDGGSDFAFLMNGTWRSLVASGADFVSSTTFSSGSILPVGLYADRYASSAVQQYGGGSLATTTTSGAITATTAAGNPTLHIGSNIGANFFWNGPIAEYIIFNRALTREELTSVEAYLAAKWGIANVHAPAVTASDPVGYWRDRSGNGRHATQSTAASRPVVGSQNGRKALTFVSKNMRGPATAFNGPVTAYWAGKTGQATAGAFVFADGSVNQTDAFHFGWENNEGPGGFGNGWSGGNSPRSRTVYGLGASWRSQPIIGGIHFSSAEGFATVNGARTTAGLAGELSQATAASFAIGSDLGSWTNLNGDIYELLIYSRALSTAERRKVEVYLARRWGITLAPQVANAEAQDWINRVYAAGSTVSQPVANAVSDFITGCQSDGIWDAMKSVVLLAGADTLAGALAPMKGTAPTSYNFASGDYNKTSGLKGNGSSTYLNSNRLASTDPQNDFHMACWIQQTSSVVGMYLGGQANTPNDIYPLVNDLVFRSRSGNTLAVGAATTTGFAGQSRSLSSEFLHRVGGSTVTASVASGTADAQDIYVLARNNNGATQNYNNGRISFYSIGESLDLALLDARVSALMTAIGVS